MNWKYTDSTERVVMRANKNGALESCLVSAIADWIAAGNSPEPADEPTLSDIRAIALTEIRKQRAPILTTLDGIAGRMFRAGDTVTASAADVAINALLDITKLPALLQATTYDDMKAAVLARYRQIAAESPAVVQLAFIEAVAP